MKSLFLFVTVVLSSQAFAMTAKVLASNATDSYPAKSCVLSDKACLKIACQSAEKSAIELAEKLCEALQGTLTRTSNDLKFVINFDSLASTSVKKWGCQAYGDIDCNY